MKREDELIKKAIEAKKKLTKIRYERKHIPIGNTRIIKKFKAYGFECIICVVRGAWYTAYVGIPKGHPFYKKNYEYVDEYVSAHGGITYSGNYVLDYKPKNTWFIGIDFCHAGDKCVGEHITNPDFFLPLIPANIWTLKKVEKEIRNLAKQLKVKNLIISNL